MRLSVIRLPESSKHVTRRRGVRFSLGVDVPRWQSFSFWDLAHACGSSADRMIHSSSDGEPDEGRSTEKGQRLRFLSGTRICQKTSHSLIFRGCERERSERSPLEIPLRRSEASQETQSWEKHPDIKGMRREEYELKEYREEISVALQTGDR